MRRFTLLSVGIGLLGLMAPASHAQGDETISDRVVGIAGDPAETWSLTRCLNAAMDGNGDLEQERLRRKEIGGQAWQTVSLALPSIDLSGNWSRSRDPSFLLDNSFGGGGDVPADSAFGGFTFPTPDELEAQSFWRTQAAVDWELNPYRIYNASRGIRTRIHQHDQELLAAEHSAVERTMAGYYAVLSEAERLASVDAELEARREFLDITRNRFRLGLATELDTLRAAVALANLQPEKTRAAKNLYAATSDLNILMGRAPDAPLAIESEVEIERDEIDVDAAKARAQQRPSLRSLGLSLEVLRKTRGAERALHLPYLSLGGQYGYVARDLDTLGDYDFWNASATLVVPLFNGNSIGRVKELNGTIARTRTALADAERGAHQEVTTTIEELLAARENLRAAELNVRAAERALEQITARFDRGQSQYLEVLNAQSDRTSARSNLINARYDVLVQTAALKRSMGVDPRTPLAELARPEASR